MPYASGTTRAKIIDPAPDRSGGVAMLPVTDARTVSQLDAVLDRLQELIDAVRSK